MPQSGKQSDRMGLRADSVLGLCKASSAWKGLETEALVSLTLASEPSFRVHALPAIYNYAYRRDRERLVQLAPVRWWEAVRAWRLRAQEPEEIVSGRRVARVLPLREIVQPNAALLHRLFCARIWLPLG